MSEQYSPPERIYLQVDTESSDPLGEQDPPDFEGVTWCQHRIFPEDVEYLRRDGETVRGLVEALMEFDCPNPSRATPGQPTVGKCFNSGNCVCDQGVALAKARGEEKG